MHVYFLWKLLKRFVLDCWKRGFYLTPVTGAISGSISCWKFQKQKANEKLHFDNLKRIFEKSDKFLTVFVFKRKVKSVILNFLMSVNQYQIMILAENFQNHEVFKYCQKGVNDFYCYLYFTLNKTLKFSEIF